MAGGTVVGMWRYPLKSAQGEAVARVLTGRHGVAGDRAWAVRDVTSGAVLSAKREPRLMLIGARAVGEGLEVMLPETAWMTGARADAAITEFLGRPVTVTRAPDDGPAYVDEADLHLLTVAALGAWDVRRFRPNLLLDTRVDLDDALGYRVRLGSVTLEVTKRTKRCAMTTCAQPGLPKDVGVLRSLAHERDLRQGVYARVVTPGRITLGDDMHLL